MARNVESTRITYEAVARAFGLSEIEVAEVNLTRGLITFVHKSDKHPAMEGSTVYENRTITADEVWTTCIGDSIHRG